ncbi:HAMP domain-containing sensor histidine kinase [Luteimicrobium xylanilyticum]|uniref:Signal transduction histidine-protein kinase/phosphatase MprB n=1 Tax=Luteimicrobium xylanilyticum TaxID=1133546 RepID=A0A5P9QF23_9MICO|nr:HAMP domain-containing sensor histidine kinase [Luteimicrobium xylanilyticum]QFV00094.1 Histidine kinase [Luteimicrobium xylanilyticum]
MIPLPDLGVIVAVALACACAVGLVGLGVLRLARRASLTAQLCVVVLAAVLSVVAGMVAVARAMYLSGHDLVVAMWVAGVSGVVAVAVALVLGRGLVQDVRRARSLAREVGEGRTVRAAVAGSSELAALTAELAATSERLAEARAEAERVERSRRDLVAWISHDLRTPLAGLRAMAEALEDGLVDDPARYHRQIRLQVDRLSGMVDDLFELSRVHSGTLALCMEPVALYDLVSDAVAELTPLARARAVTLRQTGPTDLTVVGDARELARAVGNLLMNALQHSPAGSEVMVSTTAEPGDRVAVSVVDAGGGIPEADLTRVFEAGWRGSSARTPETVDDAADHVRATGAGLGLAIARGIAEAHDGGIRVRNVPGGCQFDVLLPRLDTTMVG